MAAGESVPALSLYQALQQLPDPRRAQGKRYQLAVIMSLLVLAKLAGQKTLSGATQWIRHRAFSLAEHFGLHREDGPCHMTYCTILAAVDRKQLDDLFAAYCVCCEGKTPV